MTAGQLRDYFIEYCKTHQPTDEVLLFDEAAGTDTFFRIHAAVKTKFNKIIVKANTEIKKVIFKRNAYCKKCKNFVCESKGVKRCIDCNNPRCGEILKNVIEYEGSPCMDYDPINPTYVDGVVETEPAKRKNVNVIALMFDKYEELT